MFVITYFNRNLGRAVEARFNSFEKANSAANEIFRQTGIIVGIENCV